MPLVTKALWVVLTLSVLAPAVSSQELLVSSQGSDVVVAVDGTTARTFAFAPELERPSGITFGPDGHLYVAAGNTTRIVRFNGLTGEFLDVFLDDERLDRPGNIGFGPDGGFYVTARSRNQVLRYDPETRSLDSIAAEGGGLDEPISFAFGPDGHLYVSSSRSHQILRYEGVTGTPLGVFVSTGLASPRDINFGPEGHLYATNGANGQILRFDGQSGALLDIFIDDPELSDPFGFTWGPDARLYVASEARSEIRRYDGVTGALLDVLVVSETTVLDLPSFVVFERSLGGVSLGRIADSGGPVKLVVTGATPGGSLTIVVGLPAGETTLGACPNVYLGEISAVEAIMRVADESGNAVVIGLPPELGSGIVSAQAVDLSTCTVSALLELRVP